VPNGLPSFVHLDVVRKICTHSNGVQNRIPWQVQIVIQSDSAKQATSHLDNIWNGSYKPVEMGHFLWVRVPSGRAAQIRLAAGKKSRFGSYVHRGSDLLIKWRRSVPLWDWVYGRIWTSVSRSLIMAKVSRIISISRKCSFSATVKADDSAADCSSSVSISNDFRVTFFL
jgi:hypothetical protein